MDEIFCFVDTIIPCLFLYFFIISQLFCTYLFCTNILLVFEVMNLLHVYFLQGVPKTENTRIYNVMNLSRIEHAIVHLVSGVLGDQRF